MAMTASEQIAPYYSLGIDKEAKPITRAADAEAGPDDASMVIIDNQWPGAFFSDKIAELDKELRDAKEAGRPYKMVVIDTLKAFTGPPPSPNMNAYDWEKTCGQALYDLSLSFGIALVVIHHSNKAGEISGSTGIAAAMTKVFRLDRPVGQKDGRLICEANRAGDERSWNGVFEDGVWTMTDQVTRAFVECTGHQARILQALAAGPLALEEICAALRDTASKPVVKNALTRLREKGHIGRTGDGRWALAEGVLPPPGDLLSPEPEPSLWGPGTIGEAANPVPRIGVCAGCGGSMKIVTEGQTTHPTCEPEPGQPAADDDNRTVRNSTSEHSAPAAGVGEDQVPAPDSGPELADVADHQGAEADRDMCPDCGEPRTDADRHPDCTEPGKEKPPTWPAFKLLDDVLKKSKMHPIWFVPRIGDAKATPENNRGLPQWGAAIEADATAEGGFRWTRPGLIEEFGADALASTWDRAQFYPSSCNSVPLAANELFHTGPLDRDPRAYGKPNPASREGNPVGCAGVALVTVPIWDDSRVPHPMGRNAVPGERLWITTGLLEGLWDLHRQGIISAPPEVTDSHTGRRTTSLLDGFAAGVRAAREKYADDPVMTAAVKRSSSTALRMLYSTKRSGWWRPDWRAAMVAEGCYRFWKGAHGVTTNHGIAVAGMSNTDAISFVVPEGADAGAWEPPGYKIGSGPGMIHPAHVIVHPDRCDLSSVDPANITPTGYRGYVKVTGPVPLHVFVTRRGGDDRA
jgi:hypothetical protein